MDLRDPAAPLLLPSLLQRWRNAQDAATSAEHVRAAEHSTAACLRSGSWLFGAYHPAGSALLPPLYTPDGPAQTPASQLRAITAFYTDLFARRPAPPDSGSATATLLSAVRLRLDHASATRIGHAFSSAELLAALASANHNSSSGPDGIPYKVYLAAFDAVSPHLLDLANSLCAGDTINVSARTILLAKAGDPSDLANYCPITISNAYIRTLSRLVAGRLGGVGHLLLPWTQAAFLPGRQSNIIVATLHALTALRDLGPGPLQPPPMFIISLDQRKAYDRVDRTWLFSVLRHVGLPPNLLNLLAAIYSNPTTRASALGSASGTIPLRAGVLQGDAFSCLLYNISLQPLLDLLASRGIGVDVPVLGHLSSLAFADDCLLFVPASPAGAAQLPALFQSLEQYALASGASINYGKSCFWLSGQPADDDRTAANNISDALQNYGLTKAPPGGPPTHLGHPLPAADPLFPSSPASSPIMDRLAAIQKRATQFRTYGIDLLTRVRNSNRFLGARLWHTLAVGGLPATLRATYLGALLPYLTQNRSWVSASTLYALPSAGGFGLIEADAMSTGMAISFCRHWLLSTSPVGAWLRAGLESYLARRHRVPPAILLVRQGRIFSSLQSTNTRADGFFGRLTHALASVRLGLDPSWVSLPPEALLTLPWHMPWTETPNVPGLSAAALRDLRAGGWLTWADVLWLRRFPSSSRAHFASFPLGPPPGLSVVRNGHKPHPTYGFRQLSGPP